MAAFLLLNFPSVPSPYAGSAITKIVNVKESGGQGLKWSYTAKDGGMVMNRTYKNTMRVFTNSPFVGPVQVIEALIGVGVVQGAYYIFPLIELNGDGVAPAHTEEDTGSFLQSISLEQEAEDALQWKAVFEYGPFDINHEVGANNNPLEKAPDVEWSAVIEEVSYPADVNGIPFLNTVGDPLENVPPRKESRQSLLFVRNEASYSDNYAQQYRQQLNEYEFLGFDPGQAKCANITGKRFYTADYGYYWEVRYEFEFRVVAETTPTTYDPATGLANQGTTTIYGFQDRVLNAGYRQIVDGNVTSIIVGGAPVSSPVALSVEGVPLNLGVTEDPDSQEPEPYYLTFNQYGSVDFTNLNIPTDILTANQ